MPDRARARAIRCESCLSLHSRLVVASLSLSLPLSLSFLFLSSRFAPYRSLFKHTWKIRVAPTTLSRDFRRDSANVSAARIAWPFSRFPLFPSFSFSFFRGEFFFFRPRKSARIANVGLLRACLSSNKSKQVRDSLFLSQNRFFILNRIVDMWCTERLTREFFIQWKKSIYTSIWELCDLILFHPSFIPRYILQEERYIIRLSHLFSLSSSYIFRLKYFILFWKYL